MIALATLFSAAIAGAAAYGTYRKQAMHTHGTLQSPIEEPPTSSPGRKAYCQSEGCRPVAYTSTTFGYSLNVPPYWKRIISTEEGGENPAEPATFGSPCVSSASICMTASTIPEKKPWSGTLASYVTHFLQQNKASGIQPRATMLGGLPAQEVAFKVPASEHSEGFYEVATITLRDGKPFYIIGIEYIENSIDRSDPGEIQNIDSYHSLVESVKFL